MVQIGNYRQRFFDSSEDKDYYIKCFQKYRAQFKVKLYSWCIMDNHVHFVIEPSTENGLVLLFKNLNVKYSHYINSKRMMRVQLWGGRLFSSALDEEHLYKAIRYVELNPISAKMESQIGEYEWTSFQERTQKRKKILLE